VRGGTLDGPAGDGARSADEAARQEATGLREHQVKVCVESNNEVRRIGGSDTCTGAI
jgi:hypothetical protein